MIFADWVCLILCGPVVIFAALVILGWIFTFVYVFIYKLIIENDLYKEIGQLVIKIDSMIIRDVLK